MKKDKQNLLLELLNQNDDWMSSESLAKLLHVTPRTVRNYVKQIREEMLINIEASKNGYRLKETVSSGFIKDSQIDERIYFIMSKLLSSPNGISVFELAEELLVSESTILNSSIPKIKKIILPFNLAILTKNYNIFLKGSESDKRKMIGYLVTHNNYGFFMSKDTLEKIFPAFDIDNLMTNLYNLFEDSALFINNYAMNNLLIHILIILIRVSSNEQLTTLKDKNNIEELLSSFPQKNEIIKLANNIYDYFNNCFNIDIPEKDYLQIILLIFLSVNYDIENLNSIIDHSFIANMRELIFQVSHRYNIEIFSQEFISQLTLHMYNAKERSQFNISYPNPFSQEVKEEYALIYDMAVYFAHIFSEKYFITLSENEIAFIAFHFGAYLENNLNYQSAVTCIIIVEDYLNFSKVIYQQIKNNFHNEMIIKQVMSLNQYIKIKPKCDLLISMFNVPLEHTHKIIIKPIITNNDLTVIRSELEVILQKKKIEHARTFLRNCFYEKLYFRNIHLDSSSTYIRFMGNECLKNNFIQSKFIEDVLLRESLSSTAFADFLAIPHTLNQYADSSFICVVHNDLPITWNKNKINFILLIGVAQSDMQYFNDAFNILTELFLSPDKQIELLKTNNIRELIWIVLENNQ